MTEAETLLKSGEVSSMIKQGFISPSLTPPNSTAPTSHPSPTNSLYNMIARESTAQNSHLNAQQLKRVQIEDRIRRMLLPDQKSDGLGARNVELWISSNDGVRVCINLHRKVLAKNSKFFRENLGKKGGVVEISECDDVEIYAQVVALMYHCGDLKNKLVGEHISRVIGLLKVSAAIMFDAGALACLEILEAIPWSEDQEKEIVSTLIHLNHHQWITEVLQRVSVSPATSSREEDIFSQLLIGVLEAKDEKARRDMKLLILRLIREGKTQKDISKEKVYYLCDECIKCLHMCITDAESMGNIARHAENIHWLVEIMILKKYVDEFVSIWADQTRLASLHKKIPSMYRFGISKITAQLCVSLGRGEIILPKNVKYELLEVWLDALYDDFGWMKRVSKGMDKNVVEDGVCKTILTLSMQQQEILLMRWLDQFLKRGNDCPNLQRAFEVWWRRAFVRRYEAHCDEPGLQIALYDYSK